MLEFQLKSCLYISDKSHTQNKDWGKLVKTFD